MLLRSFVSLWLACACAALASGCGLLLGQELQSSAPAGGMDAGRNDSDASFSTRDAELMVADASPLSDTGPVPPDLAEFGDPCMQSTECASGHCVDPAESGCRRGFCTVGCSVDAECFEALTDGGYEIPPGTVGICVRGVCAVGPILCRAVTMAR